MIEFILGLCACTLAVSATALVVAFVGRCIYELITVS